MWILMVIPYLNSSSATLQFSEENDNPDVQTSSMQDSTGRGRMMEEPAQFIWD